MEKVAFGGTIIPPKANLFTYVRIIYFPLRRRFRQFNANAFLLTNIMLAFLVKITQLNFSKGGTEYNG